MAQQFESDYIFGIHEAGGEGHMVNAGRPGWIVFTEEIGYDPNVQVIRDYRAYSDQGLGIIVRLNNGYYPSGTIPHSRNYANFAQCCANFVANSRGCTIWIIGNEMNYRLERAPSTARTAMANAASATTSATLADRLRGFFQALVQPGAGTNAPAATPADPDWWRSSPERFSAITLAAGGQGGAIGADRAATAAAADDGTEVITPALYTQCYKLCRDAIRRVPGHEADQVLIGAVAPWNNQTTYAGNTRGDWVQYFQDILNALGPSGLDGITLHTYTHQADPNLITSEQKMNPPFADRYYEFRAYQDFMNAIPATMRTLPVYLTETDQDVPWLDQNIAWVQRAYGEIHWWNQQPNNQKIRALVLYRWPVIDRWFIEGKNGVIEDFKTALQQEYRWRASALPVWPFALNNTVVTTAVVNLRRTPGYVGKDTTDILAQVPADARMTILSAAPQQKDGLDWWQVRYSPTGQSALTGWTAHKSPAGVELLRVVSDTGGDVAGTFKIGDSVRTTTVVRMRRSPGTVGKPTNDVIAELPANSVGTVLAGPRPVDGLTWWQLRIISSGQEGWAAEKLATGEALLALTTVVTPPATGKFKVGDRVVTLSAARLRQTPGYVNKPATDVVADIAQSMEGRVLGGPTQADSLTWWQLETANAQGARVSGWMAETAPGGVAILKLVEGTGTTPVTSNALAAGDLVIAASSVRARRSAGYVNKTDSDVLGEFSTRATLNLISGPQPVDGLAWWRVGGILSTGREALGWAAETAPNGTTLIARPAKLTGTQIPDKATKRYFGLPFQGNFGISQLWGENPDIYNKISYDNVPLRGHNGIDFMTPLDTPIIAVDNGVVAETVLNDPTGFGRYVKVTHSWGEAIYGHLNSISVAPGQPVARGAVLGGSGNTGFSFGPHLHFAIRINPYTRTDGWGGFSDPLPYFDPASMRLPGYVTDSSVARAAAPVQVVDPKSLRTLLAEKPGYAPDKPGVKRP